MDETSPKTSNSSSPSDFPLHNTHDYSSTTNSNLINQQQVISVNNEMMSKLSPTTPPQQDHHQQPISPPTSDIGETKTQPSEDSPSSSSSSLPSFDEQEHNQQPINTSTTTSDVGETMPRYSNLPSPLSSSSYVRAPRRPPLPFQQQQRRQLMKMAQSAYSPKQDAYVMPELPPLFQGCPPIPEFNIPKDSMERILANVVLPPMPPSMSNSPTKSLFSKQANRRKVVGPYSRPPPSSLKIIGSDESRNIKKPPFPHYTYLRPRNRPPRASPDDKLFKIPPLPSSWRASDCDNNEAASSGYGDGSEDMLADTLSLEDLGLLSTEEEIESTAESTSSSSMSSIDDNNDGQFNTTSTSTNNGDENYY